MPITRLSRIVDNLLTLAKLDNPELNLQKVPIRVRNLLAEAFWMLKPMAKKRKVQMIFPAELLQEPWILGDPDWLHLALLNVLDNAIRYTPPRGCVRVTVMPAADQVQIHFTDSGPGVPAAALPQLGTRFYRISSARERETGGSGLGLSIVREIVELHAGQLTFASPPDAGLTVTFTLPVTPAPKIEL